ncbi:hypothetical protein BC937DRAFT_86246 [Endogone sp. FLAS-F59071]|nr:hypothetical protein BC937DRAFT_86246 [Endogone sp. FLAS-F59071]|eukprot:RUS20160.1 hypothetical protein BC937DRAFT_86246 [Endogone sp. FLAS-F59071]
MLGPDGSKGAKATGGLDVTDNTDNDERRSFNDGNGLDNLLLMHLYGLSMSQIVHRVRPTASQFAPSQHSRVKSSPLVHVHVTYWSRGGPSREQRGSCQPCGQVDGFSLVILGEGLDLSAMAGGTLAGQEAQIAVAGRLELTMRLRRDKAWYESLNGWTR